MPYTCMIIDDEPLAIEALVDHITRLDDFTIIARCSDAVEAIPLVKSGKPDLIFLDIEMPELSGLDFIRSVHNPPRIILTTAYRDYAPEAFDLDVVDYLLKPVSFPRFLRAVNRFYDSLGSSNKDTGNVQVTGADYINVYADKKTHKLKQEEILYLESVGDYVAIHLHNKKILTREGISSLEKKLPRELFIRIHRSFIISLGHIESFASSEVEISGKILPVSRKYRDAVYRVLNTGKSRL